MPQVTVVAQVPAGDPDALFAKISDYERFKDHTDAVREVRIEERRGDETISWWSVNFRGGVLEWRERDLVDPDTRSIRYEQIEGDFASFTGTWQVTDLGSSVAVSYTGEFDLGMPTLASMIDPIAQRVLRENMEQILLGLLGEAARIEPLTAVG